MHYVEEFDLNFRTNTLDWVASKVKGTLGSMVASLHGVKKYLMLNVVGQDYR